MRTNLGKLKRIDLRDAWSIEPNFTKWLAEAEHLSALGEELGLDLTLLQTEANVGDFNVDILVEESGTGVKGIIENQLEMTDHDHLGKLITYSSGHDAGYVIWIFKDMREEHRQAIDWLNEHTTDDVNFFGVKLELWQIGDSEPAPKFDVICRPNEWAKTVKQQTAQGEPSEGKLRQLEFWTQLRDYAKNTGNNMKLQSPQPQHWTNISIGTSGAHVALTMNMPANRLGCELYINDDKELFRYLQTQTEEIEKEIGTKLEWIEARKAARILQRTEDFDITKPEEYPKHFDWLLSRAEAFKKAFSERVRTFKQAV